MYISKNAAQEIVREIGKDIDENINMMDKNGYIIASTDLKRIGQQHAGAKKIIDENLRELYINKSMENETTRKGINLPLIIDDEIIGVVGITGEKEKVTSYGNIVRHLTEILIKERMKQEAKKYDRRVKYRFIEEWLSKSGKVYSKDFIIRGHNLGIDILKNYRIMAFYFPDFRNLSESLEGQELLEKMEASIRHEAERNDMIYLRQPPLQFCIIPHCSDRYITDFAKKIIDMEYEKYKKRTVSGYDSLEKSENMKQRLKQAQTAVLNAMSMDVEISSYDKLFVEIFLKDISEETMQAYLEKLFQNIDRQSWDYYFELINSYFQNEGSIKKMAEEKFMHKNTLQYKLKKLEKECGKDIRLPSNQVIFFMALIFYRNLYKSETGRQKAEEFYHITE